MGPLIGMLCADTTLKLGISVKRLTQFCKPHGLRKAAGRRLAEAGCTANEIMSVLGHKTLAEAERYTRAADQEKLATAALLRLEGRSANKIAQTAKRGLGKKPKTTEESK